MESVKGERPYTTKVADWERRHQNALSVYDDIGTNPQAEIRMCKILNIKLENGDYSMASTSVLGKRNNDYFGPDNYFTTLTKR